MAGGLAAAGGTLAAGALSMTGSSAQAFAAAPEAAPFPKTPDEALARLLAGNKRFVQGKPEHPRRDSAQRIKTAQGQKPFAIILTCSDSRLAPEDIFDEGLGSLFIVRVAGNTGTDPILIGSMEYSVITFGSVLLMVLGPQTVAPSRPRSTWSPKAPRCPASCPPSRSRSRPRSEPSRVSPPISSSTPRSTRT
jgi:carbonic anhydrase